MRHPKTTATRDCRSFQLRRTPEHPRIHPHWANAQKRSEENEKANTAQGPPRGLTLQWWKVLGL